MSSSPTNSHKPFGGKYDLLSALWGQSTVRGPNLQKLAWISSIIEKRSRNEKQRKQKQKLYYWLIRPKSKHGIKEVWRVHKKTE